MLKKSLMLTAVICLLFSCAKEELTQPDPAANFRVIFTIDEDDDLRTGGDDDDDIDGAVLDNSGNGINNVEVQLDYSNGSYIDTDYTELQGDFKFENLSPGDYKVRVKPNTGNEEVFDVRIY